MTGYGQAVATFGSLRVHVDLRTVNHRFFSPSIKLPGSLGACEPEVRDAMRRAISRGHATLSVKCERLAEVVAGIDEARFAAAAAELERLCKTYGVAGGVDLATVLRMPEVMSAQREEGEEELSREDLLSVIRAALDNLDNSRLSEGARMVAVLEERLSLLEAAIDRIAARAPERVLEYREKLRAAVQELVGGLSVDEARLAQEVAIMADRMDIAEELDRFRSHLSAFRATLGSDNTEPVGKRLGFLLQEMLREVNTTGSKASDTTVLHEVVGLKEELERIREQVENLE